MSLDTHVVKSSVMSTAEEGRQVVSVVLSQLNLTKLWPVVATGKRLIAATTIFSLLAALLFVLVATPQYTAAIQILIDPSDLRVVENGLTSNSQLSDALVIQVESQVRVLRSDNVLRRVIAREGLDNDPEFAGSQTSFVRSILAAILTPFGLSHTISHDDPTLAALYELHRRINVRRAERTYVVDVAVRTKDRDKSARIVNAIAQAFLHEQTMARSDAARLASESLGARLSELKERVRKAEKAVEDFKVRKNILGASGQLVNEQQLSELNNHLSLARARTAEARARFEQVKVLQRSGGDLGGFTEAVQSQAITALRAQYAEILRREAEQLASLGARHPTVTELRAQAQRLRGMITDEINRIAEAAGTDYARAQASEASLTKTLEQLKQNTILTNEARVELRELEREVQASRAVYESFLVRARETGEQEQLYTKNIRIISKADVPLRRSWPPPYLLIALGAAIFGISAGTGLTFLRARDGRIRPPSQHLEEPQSRSRAEPDLDIPLLARLPALPAGPLLKAFDYSSGLPGAELRRLYRIVRGDHLKWASQSILLLATESGAESAAVGINLAMLAAAEHSVLLVDADPKAQAVAALLGNRAEAGLMDVACGRTLLSKAAVQDPKTNVHVLPLFVNRAGGYGEIGNEDIKRAFAQTGRYDLVVVVGTIHGGSPLGLFFASLVHQIVLVTKAGMTDERDVDELLANFGDDAHKLSGAVLIDAKP